MGNCYPAIVIATFNRPNSLHRLLCSIQSANYTATEVPLIISIDGGGDDKVLAIAEDFKWEHGTKRIIQHSQNIGLREHILFCGDLTKEYGIVIVLEDDLVVSPYFYTYVCETQKMYGVDNRIAGVSLYSYRMNEFAELPFVPTDSGCDVYFIQTPSSWGQSWTCQQWEGFRAFMKENPTIEVADRIPECVKRWPASSWKKHFCKYMASKNLFFVFPYISYSTNFAEVGTHFKEHSRRFQVPLAMNSVSFRFMNFDDCPIKYDAYMDPLQESFNGVWDNKDVCVDLYGIKQKELFNQTQWLTTKKTNAADRTFGLEMLPLENNVFFQIPGGIISLADSGNVTGSNSAFRDECNLLFSEYSYASGFYNGFELVRSSKSFKIGNLLLKPISFFKKLLNKD